MDIDSFDFNQFANSQQKARSYAANLKCIAGAGKLIQSSKNFMWNGKKELDLNRKTSTMARKVRKHSTIGIYHVMLRGIN